MKTICLDVEGLIIEEVVAVARNWTASEGV